MTCERISGYFRLISGQLSGMILFWKKHVTLMTEIS